MTKYFQSYLTPTINPIITEGKVLFKESHRARCLILLNKTILRELTELHGKETLINYQCEYYRTFKELDNRIIELKQTNSLPFLFFFKRVK